MIGVKTRKLGVSAKMAFDVGKNWFQGCLFPLKYTEKLRSSIIVTSLIRVSEINVILQLQILSLVFWNRKIKRFGGISRKDSCLFFFELIYPRFQRTSNMENRKWPVLKNKRQKFVSFLFWRKKFFSKKTGNKTMGYQFKRSNLISFKSLWNINSNTVFYTFSLFKSFIIDWLICAEPVFHFQGLEKLVKSSGFVNGSASTRLIYH